MYKVEITLISGEKITLNYETEERQMGVMREIANYICKGKMRCFQVDDDIIIPIKAIVMIRKV